MLLDDLYRCSSLLLLLLLLSGGSRRWWSLPFMGRGGPRGGWRRRGRGQAKETKLQMWKGAVKRQ